GMLILAWFLILLGWQSYAQKLKNTETEHISYMYGIPILHIDTLTEDSDRDMFDAAGNIQKVFNRRKRRSPQTVIGLVSQSNDISNERDADLFYEDKNSQNLNENSDEIEKVLEKIIENEQISSKTNYNNYKNNKIYEQIDVENIASHIIAEEEEKQIINDNFRNENDYIGTNNGESKISTSHNLDIDFPYKTAIRKNIQNKYFMLEDTTNTMMGFYCGVILTCGILLIIAFVFCLKTLFNILSRKQMSGHRKLEEEEHPSTPIEKDLRFKENKEKFDLFCDLYE
ncbi:unnamed protein product, partial [Meganyctiphanes norvegica]